MAGIDTWRRKRECQVSKALQMLSTQAVCGVSEWNKTIPNSRQMERAKPQEAINMGAKVSAEMKHALFLVVQEGKSVKQSARIAGVDASSVYKALRRMDNNGTRPQPAQSDASTDYLQIKNL
jgi:hypothetical protein